MNIIYLTLQQLQEDKYYAISRNIDIAKGRNKLGGKRKKIKRGLLSFLKK